MLEQTVHFSSFDLAPDHHPRPGAILRYMQQLAREHMNTFGHTYYSMLEDGMVFILTRLSMRRITAVPGEKDLRLVTGANGVHGASFYRSFALYDGEELLLTCHTEWVLLDFANRRILRPTKLNWDAPEDPVLCGDLTAPRLAPREGGEAFARDDRKVYLSMLDENDHLNNCVYADLIFDILPPEFDWRELSLNFLKEVRRGETLSLVAERFEDAALVTGTLPDGAVSFREFGPGTTLCGLIRRIDPSVETIDL